MRRLVFLLCALLSGQAFATDIDMGGVVVKVPAPPGYQQTTPQMTWINTVSAGNLPMSNTSEGVYIADSDVPRAAMNQPMELQRYFQVQIDRGLRNTRVTDHEFQGIIASFKIVIDGASREAVDRTLSNAHNKPVVGFPQTHLIGVQPYPGLYEDDHSFAFTIATTYRTEFAGRAPIDKVVMARGATVHVKDRLVMLYAYGQRDDDAWTRQAMRSWVEQIVAANLPSSRTDQAAAEKLVSPVGAQSKASNSTFGEDFFDAPIVVQLAVMGAIAVGFVSFIGWFFTARKKRKINQ